MAKNHLIKNAIILQILEKYKVLWALNHFSALGHWDLETHMPEDGAAARAEALAKVSVLYQSLFLEKDFISLINNAEEEDKAGKLNDNEKAILRVLKRALKYYQKLPPEFIEEFSRLTNESHLIWKKAREKNDFSIFEPYLERIVELSKTKAELLGYKEHTYDALLDEYEEGLTTKDAEAYFSKIKSPIIALLNYIKSSPKYRIEHEMEKEPYEEAKIHALNQKLLKKIHYNLNHLRLDVSAHPFSTCIGPGDLQQCNA